MHKPMESPAFSRATPSSSRSVFVLARLDRLEFDRPKFDHQSANLELTPPGEVFPAPGVRVQWSPARDHVGMAVNLLVPIKPLARAKTRLLGAADDGDGDPVAHARLVVALARDTLAAAAAAALVRRAVAVCSDGLVRRILAMDGVEAVADEPGHGLNSALRYGEALLRSADPATAVAAMPADLPALRPRELDSALHDALGTGSRAFCSDQVGTGTTLLLAPPGHPLVPRFGPRSAVAHRAGGARELAGHWPGLRCDVDTEADLARARELGLGRFTRAVLRMGQSGISPPEDPLFTPAT
jgi:2-phospho-L-lactate guanylyltransferase